MARSSLESRKGRDLRRDGKDRRGNRIADWHETVCGRAFAGVETNVDGDHQQAPLSWRHGFEGLVGRTTIVMEAWRWGVPNANPQ